MVIIHNNTYDDAVSQCKEHFETFPFELSPFQKHAIDAIVKGDHCLVTAHTGSGKTVPAEFAIKYFVSMGKKVIYTSPIKALSNQKFYDFQQKYPEISVGLFTGDIKTNPEADVLIMTTEILMNRLFQEQTAEQRPSTEMDFQMDFQSELACVVFDEVHYINDEHRGQNWEKTILMLPMHVQMVMLSATIDGPEKFAKWCERNRDEQDGDYKEVHLCSTNHRIVPLTHYGFITTTEGLYKGIKDEALKKEIRSDMNKLVKLQSSSNQYDDNGRKTMKKYLDMMHDRNLHMKPQHVLNQLALHLRDNDMLPAIVFVFSRKKVERYASEVTVPLLEDDSKVPYTIKAECDKVLRQLPNYEEYAKLPEYNQLISLLEKGIGIHHSGMIPVFREIVELMISRRHIKMLFATESFAIGLDCPIKTAVFSSLTKFDGIEDRFLLPHEYTQMAGRAGRRGIDTIGHVVHCNNLFPLPNEKQYKAVMCGVPQKLVSKYKITYSLVLNLLQSGVKDANNLHEFSQDSMLSENVEKELETLDAKALERKTEVSEKEGQLAFLRTPVDDCRKYIELVDLLPRLKNRGKKKADRELVDLRAIHKFLDRDVVTVRAYDSAVNKLNRTMQESESTKQFIENTTRTVCNILQRGGFMDEIELTEKGKVASYMAEAHPLVLAEVLLETKYFEDRTIEQIIAYLTMFCDIKVSEDNKCYVPCGDLMQITANKLDNLDLMEGSVGYRADPTVTNYDLADYITQWIGANNDAMCRTVLCSIEEEKGISTGDFNKAMLKISGICREIANMARDLEIVHLEHKMAQVNGKILKYVTTAQSLYV